MSNMNWNNIGVNLCPKCNKELKLNCECGFKISKEKLEDLKKGKESKVYKNKVKHFQKIKKYKEAEKRKKQEIFNIQNKERLSNLNRMFRKGLITEIEYNSKVIHS